MSKIRQTYRNLAGHAETSSTRNPILRERGIWKKKKELGVSHYTIRLIAGTILAVVIVAGITSIVIGNHWPISVVGGSLGLAVAAALGFRPTVLNVFRGE